MLAEEDPEGVAQAAKASLDLSEDFGVSRGYKYISTAHYYNQRPRRTSKFTAMLKAGSAQASSCGVFLSTRVYGLPFLHSSKLASSCISPLNPSRLLVVLLFLCIGVVVLTDRRRFLRTEGEVWVRGDWWEVDVGDVSMADSQVTMEVGDGEVISEKVMAID